MPEDKVKSDNSAVDTEHNGLRGWLVFFMIVFGIGGIVNIWTFFIMLSTLLSSGNDASVIASAIICPTVGVAQLLAAVNIAMRKKLGKILAQISLVLSTLGAITMSLITLLSVSSGGISFGYGTWSFAYTSSLSSQEFVLTAGSIVVQLVVCALCCLYFQKSRRVKATLTE